MTLHSPLVCAEGGDDAEGFSRLAQPYYEPVYQFVAQQVSSKEDAADVTQAAFIRAYRSFGNFDRNRAFKPWIYRIARRAIVDHYRRSAPAMEGLDRSLPDPLPSPARETEAADTRDLLWERVGRLKPRLQQALLLHYQEDFSVREVAEVLSISTTHAKVLLFRARRALRLLLETDEKEKASR